LSDIHGNLPALEAVLADAWRAGPPDAIIVAGDLTMGGPYPAEVLDRLREVNATLIAGNRDRWILQAYHGRPPAGWHEGEHCGVGRWTLAQLRREQLPWLDSLPEQTVVTLRGAHAIRVVHGSPSHLSGRILPDRCPEAMARLRLNYGEPARSGEIPADAALLAVAEPVLVCGHTHVQWQQRLDGRLALNPGSVGESLQGDPRARYALLEWDGRAWQVELCAVEYDRQPLRRAFHERGLLAEGGGFARASLRDMETGRNFSTHFYRHVARQAQQVGLSDGDVFCDEIWQQAAATFDWENGAP
ncbi:MAG: metallophosphoesterase family protein, partial [Anaerolineae bacterium]